MRHLRGTALERIKQLAGEPRPTGVCPANTHILAEVQRDADFAFVMGKFDLVLPDGMPVIWALNCFGAGLRDRVYGPYFMRHTLARTPSQWRQVSSRRQRRHYRRFGKDGDSLAPDLEVVGSISPPFRTFTEEDEVSFAETINRAAPDFIWVALPGVRMERWIIANQARYKRGVFLAVGDAFTLLSGRRKFAPAWMQRMGLTWLFRLASEPARLGPRYLKYNFLFVFYLLRSVLRGGVVASKKSLGSN